MTVNEMPELGLLKSRLDALVREHSVRKFDGEDIIELVRDGESIEWVTNQLKADSPGIDEAETAKLLAEIKQVVRPEQESSEVEPEIDLSRIGEMLPPGVELPPGLTAEEMKNVIESPHGRLMTDFFEFCRDRGVDLSSGDLKDPRVAGLEKEWESTPRDAFEGKTPAELMKTLPGRVETFRRESPRVGRNDPCPCGSGRKYKKCCGRA